MVKEVEFSNFIELYGDTSYYTGNLGDSPVMYGVLMDDGKKLVVDVNIPKPLASEGTRFLILHFSNTNFETRIVDYVKLDLLEEDNMRYTFDVERVMAIPRKVYNTRGTSEIVVELYTYEANITTDYGSKTLSVPYSVSGNTYEYSNSTDGTYRLYLVDIPAWEVNTIYNTDDIVMYNGAPFISTDDDNQGNIPTAASNFWSVPEDEDITDFAHGATTNTPLASVAADILVSRYAKYKYILNSLQRTGFKPYDNRAAFQKTSLLQMFREKAMFMLLNHKPIDAEVALQQLKTAYSSLTDTNKVRTYNIKYTS